MRSRLGQEERITLSQKVQSKGCQTFWLLKPCSNVFESHSFLMGSLQQSKIGSSALPAISPTPSFRISASSTDSMSSHLPAALTLFCLPCFSSLTYKLYSYQVAKPPELPPPLSFPLRTCTTSYQQDVGDLEDGLRAAARAVLQIPVASTQPLTSLWL